MSIKLELTADEALIVMGALNTVGNLRSVMAPITEEQLERGRLERALSMRVLEAIAEGDGEGSVTS